MEREEIIEKITGFASRGLLNGIAVEVPFRAVILRMENIWIDGVGRFRFDQYRRYPSNEGWEQVGSNYTLYEHVDSYLESVFNKICEIVERDKNLF